jgi:uroporphyrinogen-III synthase
MESSLSGKTILITRDMNQAKPMVDRLKNLGAVVLIFPTIKISPPDNPDLIRGYLADISVFEWIVFTSSNAVRYFDKFKNREQKNLKNIKIACVGKKTTEALEELNLTPVVVPNVQTSRGLLEAILNHDIKGQRILLPVSNLASKDIQEGLQAHGAHVERIEVYKNVPFPNHNRELIYKKIDNNIIDCITFYSPSAINSFANLMGEKGISLINTRKIPIAVIGSTTALAARDQNLHPTIQPIQSDDQNFVQGLIEYFNKA